MAAADSVKKVLRAFNRHDAKAVAAGYAPKVVVYDPFYPQPLKGREAVLQDARAFFKAFPDMKLKLITLLTKGNTYAAEAQYSGTHTGPLAGPGGSIPPTNRRINASMGVFGRVGAGGLITAERRHYDTATMMTQLGIKPGS